MPPSPDQLRHMAAEYALIRKADFPWPRGPKDSANRKPKETPTAVFQAVQSHLSDVIRRMLPQPGPKKFSPFAEPAPEQIAAQELQGETRLLRHISSEMLDACFQILRGQKTDADARSDFRELVRCIDSKHVMILEPGHPLFSRGQPVPNSKFSFLQATKQEQTAVRWLLGKGTDQLIVEAFANPEQAQVAGFQTALRRDVAVLLDTPEADRPNDLRGEQALRQHILNRTVKAWEDESLAEQKDKQDPVNVLLDDLRIKEDFEKLPLETVMMTLMSPASVSLAEEQRRLPVFELTMFQRLLEDKEFNPEIMNICNHWETLTNAHGIPVCERPRLGLIMMALHAKHGFLVPPPAPTDPFGDAQLTPMTTANNLRDFIFVPEKMNGKKP